MIEYETMIILLAGPSPTAGAELPSAILSSTASFSYFSDICSVTPRSLLPSSMIDGTSVNWNIFFKVSHPTTSNHASWQTYQHRLLSPVLRETFYILIFFFEAVFRGADIGRFFLAGNKLAEYLFA